MKRPVLVLKIPPHPHSPPLTRYLASQVGWFFVPRRTALSCQPVVESREVRDAQGRTTLFQFRVLVWALLLLNL
jgi:hypothetical protein